MSRRLLLVVPIVALSLVIGAIAWLNSGGGAVVEVSDEDVEAARESGDGARELVVDSEGEAPLPTVESLKLVGRRTDLNAIAERVATERAAAQGEDRALLSALLSEVERLRRNGEACYELAREAAEAFPTNSRVRLAMAKGIFAKVFSQSDPGDVGVGDLAAAIGQLKPYLAEVRVAIDLDPANVDARVLEIAGLSHLPWPLGNKKQAKALVEEVGQYDVLRRDFWRAQLLAVDRKKLADAIEAFQALYDEYPGDLDIALTLGDLHFKAEAWQRAAECVEALVTGESTPFCYRAMYQGAKAREMGRFELDVALDRLEALEAADPIGDLVPSLSRIKLHKGRVLKHLDRLEEARVALKQALELAPGRAAIAESLETVERRLAERNGDG